VKEYLSQLKKLVNQNTSDLATRKLRLGVTGFARSGKTVFIGALTQALLSASNRHERKDGPLQQFDAYERGILRSVRVCDEAQPLMQQFPFRQVRDALLDQHKGWPEPTRGISSLTLEFDFASQQAAGRFFKDSLGLGELGMGKLQLEIVDFPGEWLVDLPMLGLDYAQWSSQVLDAASRGSRAELAADFMQQLAELADAAPLDEAVLEQLQHAWTGYLQQAVARGFTANQPGRHLSPDQLAGSPVLRFVPLPQRLQGSALYQRCNERFVVYQQQVIKPFYRDVFSRMDRQLVLVDVLRLLELGEEAFTDMQQSLSRILQNFDYGKGGLLSWLTGHRTSRVLFAATKADHVTRGDRRNLEDLLANMLAIVDEHNRLRGSTREWEVMALASVRATEDKATVSEPVREVLYGKPAGENELAYWDPGGLPLDMPPNWEQLRFRFYRFAPLPYPQALQKGFPAINLGRAVQFLLGERTR